MGLTVHRPKPQVVVTRRLPEPVEARLRREFAPALNEKDVAWSEHELIQLASRADALVVTITDSVSESVIQKLPESLKIIASFSAGLEHIDVAAATARGIVVCNAPDSLTEATAEIAILLMLGAARRASEGEALMRAGAWHGWRPTHLLGKQLHGRTLGVVGFGRIGQATAKIASSLGMRILYHSRRPVTGATQLGAKFFADVDAMLGHCDVLSLHCPSTPATRRLLDARRLAMLPRGCIVVNTARGDLVDDDALIDALRSEHVAGAGLDVFNNEPRFRAEYRSIPTTFLLPHLGSATREAREAMGMCALDNLAAFFSGRKPTHAIN